MPLPGALPAQIDPGPPLRRVAVLGDDYVGKKLKPVVKIGQPVRRGDPLCADRANPTTPITAPAAGRIEAIHLGPKRTLRSIVIELTSGEREGSPKPDEHATLGSFTGRSPEELDEDEIRDLLCESGLWAAFRRRPFGGVPAPDEEPAALFVTAMDTNPLAPDPELVLQGQTDEFDRGLAIVARLTAGPTYLCVRADSRLGGRVRAPVSVEQFAGPHPAGTVG